MKRILLVCLVMLSFTGYSAWAQSRTVTGTVTSEGDEMGIPGVSVTLKNNPGVGTSTQVDGSYSLNVPQEGGTLVFSFVGYATTEKVIGKKSVVNVALSDDVKQLSEVVVTALGVAQDKKELGYSVQDVKGDELTKAKETNIVNSLSGQIAGVQVTSSGGGVGNSSRIVLRGATSITGNNQPLFVVDGVPISNSNFGNAGSGGGVDMPNGAADINPDDIETVSVLKGPNAAALYGSRASNGVILITTKKGSASDGVRVSVNSNYTVQDPLKLPSYQNEYGQGYDIKYFEYVDGSNGNGGEDESWGPALDRGLEFVQWNSNGEPAPWVSRPNNVRDFLETGITHTNNIAVSGGNEMANYRVSFTNLGQEGMIPNTNFGRQNLTVNSGVKADKFSANVALTYTKSASDNLPTVGYNGRNPMQQFTWFGRNVDLQAHKNYQELPLAADGTSAANTPANWNTNYNNNPYWVLHNNIYSLDKDRLFGNINMSYEITDWLKVSGRTGTDYFTDIQKESVSKYNNQDPLGNYTEWHRTITEMNHQLMFMVDKTFGDFSVNATFGGQIMDRKYTRLIADAPELEQEGIFNFSNSSAAVNGYNYYSQKRINSFLGSAKFGYKNYLFLDVTARNDWSSTLPVENNSYFYPSASLSAVLTDMFEVQSDVLSFAKIRGGWAQVGSDTDPYRLQNIMAFRTPWNGGVISPTVSNTLLSPNLRPEITSSTEFGVDLRFFNGRINLDATYYSSLSEDLIMPVDISSATGYSQQYLNVGSMSNKGIEIQLNTTPVKSNDFQWDLGVNFARNRNRVESLSQDPKLDQLVLGGQWNMDVVAQPGQPYGLIFGTAFARDSVSGEIIYEDGSPLMADDSKVLGDVQPDWTGGLRNTFTYKGLSLNVLVDAKMGGDVYSMTNAWGRYAGVMNETLIGREQGVIGKGVKNIGTEENPEYVPNDVAVDAKTLNHAAFGNSIVEGSVFDASYVKLRQVAISYTLPNDRLGKFPLRDISFSIVGRNLALLYSTAPHIDPETAFSNSNAQLGQEHAQLPSARSLGFNVSFKL